MLNNWTKILPYFFVVWYTKKYCERESLHTPPVLTVVCPYKGVYIEVEEGK